jgi:A118 family predicted phage portal protein
MAFPREGTEFPPESYKNYFNKLYEWRAWYSGDPEQLLALYSSTLYFPDTDNGRFWKRIEAEERVGIVHLPAAGDVASTSANLLFSESPVFKYNENAASGERIKTFIKENGILNLLLESSELAAALGGICLKIDIDSSLLKIPIVSIINPLQFIPSFRRGRLWEILFFRTVREGMGGTVVWRLFEDRRRENGKLVIEYKLYRGSQDRVGREVGMETIDETVNLGLENITYDIEGLGCVYIPNMRPNKLDPGSSVGINDYSGCVPLMDSLDFSWTSWMRDIELGMAQILVDEELLEGEHRTFNKFRKAFLKLNLSQWRMGGENVKPIEMVQFELRVDDHSKTCEALFYNIVTQSGYSPQTFGLGVEGRAESGTALRVRERKSMLTRDKKSRYWQPALWELFWQMQQIDIKSNLSPGYQPQEVEVIPEDSITVDTREQSETIRNLEQAKAISTYTKIKMIHPEWEDKDIKNEVEQILNEQGIMEMPFKKEDV